MQKNEGELTTIEVADLTGAHPKTVRGWANALRSGESSITPRGAENSITKVRINVCGFMFFDESEIRSIFPRNDSALF